MSDPLAIRTHPQGRERLPEGQHSTIKWPVLTYGPTPEIDPVDWRLRIWGACTTPVELDWAALQRLSLVRIRADMHCVTTWSRLDMVWGGYLLREVLALAAPLPDCTHVLQHGYGGYTTNTGLPALLDEDALLAVEADGAPLDREHGGPARIVVPKLWAWKGAKWICGLELLTTDRRGFWEVNGYHNHGDPWGEGGERYSHQERAVQTRKEGNQLRRR